MSARDERAALTPGTSLHDYALFRQGIEPDGRFPRRGHPLPDGHPGPKPGRSRLTWHQAEEEVAAALAPLLADPDPVRAADAVHLRVRDLVMPDRTLRAHVARLPLPDEAAARRTARRLTRTGTDTAAVSVGLALLIRLGEAEDVPVLKTLGLLRGLARAAAAALDPLDRQAAALLLLADRSRSRELTPLIDAVATGDTEAVRDALVTLARDAEVLWLARRIAEAADLDGLLRARPEDGTLFAAAGRLLHRMAGQREGRAEILDYRPALAVYEALVGHADRPAPALGHHALLLSVALDLHSGTAVLLDWRPGQREALLDALGRVLQEPVPDGGPAVRRRTEWIRRTGRQPFVRAAAGERFRIEVVVDDPADPPAVETRILVDGRPLVPLLFGKGPANAPECLLDTGGLRAGAEPHEVQLAEAYCAEGCCGALYVTIRRDGDEVVWGEWRGAVGPTPPEYRFDAAAYDAEVGRAERDRSWCWPARNTARLIKAGLRERPDLLTRWDVEPGWVGTDWREPDTVDVDFSAPPEPDPASETGTEAGQGQGQGPGPGPGPAPAPAPAASRRYFRWAVPDDGRPPEVQAAAVLERLATTDPKTLGTAPF
ncbi:hypothetical protein [Streptomyces sp. NPDC051211]|uniref:hypothetical protein n=1 Tax=Streptomyces sp. NPDC051211 TaxID=3154643 RepID=UPI00344DA03B